MITLALFKQMEAAELIPKERKAFKACNVKEISRL